MDCSNFETDRDFVAALRSGGLDMERASGCLYRRYRNQVVHKARQSIGYRPSQFDDIRDLAQDAYIIMLKKIREGGYNDGSLLHFWIGITKGLLRNKMKRDARMNLVEEDRELDSTDSGSPESEYLTNERSAIIGELLDRLGAKCKEVLTMWAGGYSMQEIADEMQLSSEAMARKNKYKCKGRLKELMQNVKHELLF